MKVLIIGYGSIGKRHYQILNNIKKVHCLKVYTKQKIKLIDFISTKKEILEFNPNYVVVANETHKHFNVLKFLEKNFTNLKILIEKPLFHKYIDYEVIKNKVYVGYNLRFHPLLLDIKKLIYNKEIWSINIIAGSYLPDWRKSQNYKDSYSAKKNSGGVLLDLSHEIDYAHWLFGNFKIHYSIYNKVSDLDIKSNDNLNLLASFNKETIMHINLSYFFKNPIRQIIIDGKNINIQANLIENKMLIKKNNKLKKISLKNFNINNLYKDQHYEILNNNIKNTCSYKDGKNIMSLISEITKFKR